ncbi:MAG: alkaline phosphatase D family protein [Sphingomonadaceae bacterium]|nr:alkaline phosphatase D family protein [Sphingomonadaceae bacterium]
MIRIDRRQLIATAAFGTGGLLLPGGRLVAQMLSAARGFTQGVASGEPDSDSILLWTRFVGDGDSAHVRAEISETADFARVVAADQMITGPWRDWTAKITLAGLQPGRRYFYRFAGPGGAMSPVGRTKTLPVGRTTTFNIGIFSCSNLPFGYFNAYAHAAARDDLDVVYHLGDYFYEYRKGSYPSVAEGVRVAELQPESELIHLADYRLRYASYRSDPDLVAFHAAHPMIASIDDHESANDSWEGGAENHQPDKEGDWNARKAAAVQAYREWMPVDDEPWKTYQAGGLATLFKTDTRLIARSKQREIGPSIASGAAAFKAGAWIDPAETMLGTTQENWLAHAMKASARAHATWQVVGMGTIMGYAYTPEAARGWLASDAPARNRRYVDDGIAAAKAGLPNNFDNWGGYPAARARFLHMAQAAGGSTILISGDSHNGWAFELPGRGAPAAVEFAGHSVTSPGYESALVADPRIVAAGVAAASPELKWCDTSRRGYMRLTLTPAAATNEWVFMETIKARSTATQPSHRMRVRPGRAKLETV